MINSLWIDPVAFLGVRWYAIFIMTGIVLGIIMAVREGKRLGVCSEDFYWGAIIGTPVGIIGARIWWDLFNIKELHSFVDVIAIWNGGIGIQGAIIAVIIFVFFYAKKKGLDYYRIYDIVLPGLLLGQIFGRWGNFCNHELYGPEVHNTKLFLNLLPKIITENMYIDGAYRHPTFLYESLLSLIGVILILVLRRKCKKLLCGDLGAAYLIWYGLERIFTESLRLQSGVDEPLMLGPIPVSILTSVLFIIAGITVLILKRFKGPKDYYQDVLKYVKDNKIDTVLFDLDGTLINTRPLIYASFVYTFEKYFPDHTLTDEELESFFGPTLYYTFSRYESDPDRIKEMIEYYRAFNKDQHDHYAKPFEGCRDLIKTLSRKGYKIGLVTSKKKEIVMLGLNLAKIAEYLNVMVCEDDVENHKPAPDGIYKCFEMLNPGQDIKDHNVLYVGDHPNDIKAGQAAGVKTCAMLCDNKKIDEIDELNPDFEIRKLNDILKVLVE